MSTDTELREAAERLRLLEICKSSAAVYPRGIEGYDEDCRTVARAWLAENHADDGESITPEWLSLVGLECGKSGPHFRMWRTKCRRVRVAPNVDRRSNSWRIAVSDGESATLVIGYFATRGQLSALCNALGISLAPTAGRK